MAHILSATALTAQTPAPAVDIGPWRQAIAVNALALPFGLFSAEYEVALATPGFTLGLGGSWLTTGDERESWVEGKALYYPGERVFRGFSVGLTAGVHSARNDNGVICDFGCVRTPRRTQTAPTAGVLVNYDWLLGRQQRFRVGLGVGAKRVLRDVESEDPLMQVYPDGRFVIGVAF
ncbi:MAG: hypothetical protein ACXWZS_12845 [Gemmatirosa sp.]